MKDQKYGNNINLICYIQDMLGHLLQAIYTGLVRSNVKEAIVCIHVRSNHNYMHLPNC